MTLRQRRDTNDDRRLPRVLAATCLAFFVATTLPAAFAAEVLYGLSTRPANPNCVAPELPVVVTGTRAEPAFGNLSFRTVPHDNHPSFLNGVIDMAQVPGDNDFWYVVERAGKVHRVANDDSATSFTTVLDMSSNFDGIWYFEQWGINAIALHPDFASKSQLYVLYNDNEGLGNDYVPTLSRFTSTDGGLSFDAATEEVLLTVPNAFVFHKFGDMSFGPDGYLYVSLGSPVVANGQDVNDLHGSVLRLDVNGAFPYTIPVDNPFAAGGGRAEIYAWGLRNPWRMSFDSLTGELWLGDVGESNFEEVNRIERGKNYGWSIAEGNVCVGGGCAVTTPPQHSYSHAEGQAIAGGFVYRGSAIPELYGRYLFGDTAGGLSVWALNYDGSGNVTGKEVIASGLRVTGFAQDQQGELLTIDVIDSTIHRLLPDTSGGGLPVDFPQTLSATGCVDAANPTLPASGLIPFDVNSPLWSDGASKRRWLAIPDGETIQIGPDGDFIFPVGTVLVKEFSFDGVPVETRLFMRHPNGAWAGYSYEWAADLSDANLLDTGKTKQLDNDIVWTFPSRAECLQCHNSGNNFAAGPEVAQLNQRMTFPSTGDSANQLSTLEHIGLLSAPLANSPGDLPALAALGDSSRPIATRARSYLHSNCSGCHRPGGTTQATIDLRSSTDVASMGACNATPQHGDLGVGGAQLLFPGSASQSIVSLRMHALDNNRMPPLASTLVDLAATSVIDSWIGNASVCDPQPDTDGDGVSDDLDNCTNVANAAQLDADGDGFGNACDADLNNDCVVNPTDLGLFRLGFLSVGVSSADFNGDGVVNATDLGILRNTFLSAPGPSVLGIICGS